MKSPRFPGVVLASLLAVVTLDVLGEAAAASPPGSASNRPAASGRIAIQAEVNRLFVTVQADGTLRPTSATVGTAEQFELFDLGKGLFALKSMAVDRFLTAVASRPITASAESIGVGEMFRALGADGPLIRLRGVAAKAFVCAPEGGDGSVVAMKRCPHPLQLLRVQTVQRPPVPAFTITSPIPGSVLPAATVTFSWDKSGDDAWLNVGTVPGASDIYASGSLGHVTEHTATRLPLHGGTVHVQVGRRSGALVERVDVEYTAAVRKGLAVVTDFADRKLEDWTEPGMKNVNDLSAQLRRMEAHWAWLSRGLEKFRWDIIRIQLPERAVADAYPGVNEFRDAAVLLARQQVQATDYDVNTDGVIDAMWLIVSSGNEPVPFAIGGTTRNAGANLFVDGQASGSVVAGATGNFNHELGHCLGLPDLYGTYSTMNKLTVMNDSWALPPQDFSVYERLKLGWMEPRVVRTTTAGVWLPSANDNFAAVMIPTLRDTEYFLIEYRNRPASGYGSAAPEPYKGLAVYHVLEGSSMWQDPPIVKLEPADGQILPNEPLDPFDFVYPENPALLRPMVLSSYYGDGDEVLRISNVAWRDDGLVFDIGIAAPPPGQLPTNLLTNASFEHAGSAGPEGWSPGSYVPVDAHFIWPSPIASDGLAGAALSSVSGNDLWWSQAVGSLTEGETYRLCGVMKGEAIQGVQGSVGANVSVLGGFVLSEAVSGTFDWTTRCVDFIANTSPVDVACRLGFYGSTAKGKLWCDAFRLEHLTLRSAFWP